MDIETVGQLITFIKDIVAIAASIILAVIAIYGLRTWRKQLKGKTEYELARRLLRAVYQLRDAIREVRNPYASSSEIYAALNELEIDIDVFDPEYQKQSQSALYQRRWKKVQESMSEFNVEAFEAEVLWGQSVKELLLPLRQQIGELHSMIELYLKNLQNDKRRVQSENQLERIDEIIYDFHDLSTDEPSDNEYTKKTIEAIKNIEEFIRPYIKL